MENQKQVVISFRDVEIGYNDSPSVVRDLNFDIHQGEILAIIGESGCGKSTILKLLNQIEDSLWFNGGVSIQLDDQVIDISNKDLSKESLRQHVGMVFQKPNPLPFSIYENIAHGLKIMGYKDKRGLLGWIAKISAYPLSVLSRPLPFLKSVAEYVRGRVDAFEEEKNFLQTKVKKSAKRAALWKDIRAKLESSALKLSGGQQQRLCIARALTLDPDVILMDEPTSALDPKATQKIEKLIKSLVVPDEEHPGHTVLIVTHDMNQALRIADRCLFINIRSEKPQTADEVETRWGVLVEIVNINREIPEEPYFEPPAHKETAKYLKGHLPVAEEDDDVDLLDED